MSKHTPGPWKAGRAEFATLIDGVESKWIYAGDKYVAVASGLASDNWDEVMANARLIARAPEMADTIAALTARVAELEAALEEITNLPGELNPSNYDHDDACACNAALCEAYGIARAAITKGESHD